jgi:mRNA interferase MazF
LKQYEIWWADLAKPAGKRPVLLLSRDSAYSYLHKFIVAEVTTTVRGIPIEVPLGNKEGLLKPCVANCDNLRTVSRSALIKRLGSLGASRQHEVKSAIGFALGWEELIGTS